MKICHVCQTECADDLEFCPVCNADLQSAEKAEAIEEAVIENPSLIASFEDFISAEIFMDILTENNILFTCDQPAMRVTFGGGLLANNIYVDEKDFEEAQRLYENFLQSEENFNEE